MKNLYRLSLLITCFVIACTVVSSCGLDTPEDPDFPLYVTYNISVEVEDFNGSNQLLADINKWVETNKFAYDEKVNYTTGAPEEFAESDKKAIEEKYDVFVPKFKAFLEEIKSKLANGTYGDHKQVKARFLVYCSRMQGQGKLLASEVIDFVYPSSSAE